MYFIEHFMLFTYRCQHCKVAIASVYRSSSTDVLKCFEDLHGLLSQLFVSCKYVLLAGDFNIDLLHASSSRERYHDLLIDFQLVQHIQKPTRVSTSSSTVNDHVM